MPSLRLTNEAGQLLLGYHPLVHRSVHDKGRRVLESVPPGLQDIRLDQPQYVGIQQFLVYCAEADAYPLRKLSQ